jgi:hypothetical protein
VAELEVDALAVPPLKGRLHIEILTAAVGVGITYYWEQK